MQPGIFRDTGVRRCERLAHSATVAVQERALVQRNYGTLDLLSQQSMLVHAMPTPTKDKMVQMHKKQDFLIYPSDINAEMIRQKAKKSQYEQSP